MNPQNLIKNNVLKVLTNAIEIYLNNKFPDIRIDTLKIRIEYSRDEKFGDYSSPFALENKTMFSKNPKEIADELIPLILKEDFLSEVSFSPPGFINFRINTMFLWKFITDFSFGDGYFVKVPIRKKILLEFVSANPTGPMNIVSARSAAFGDALANLLTSLGHEVKREFYVNDYGNQVDLLGVALLIRYFEMKGDQVKFQEDENEKSIHTLIEERTLPKESYRGEYIKDIVRAYLEDKTKKSILEDQIENKDWDKIIVTLSRFAVSYNLEGQKKDLALFGVEFDEFFSERSLHESGAVLRVESMLKKEDLKVEEGKLLFLSTLYGDDKDRVIRRSDGRPTYLMADIAYHQNKYERGFDELIDVWGPDHYGYIARLKGAVESFGKSPDSFQVLIAQQVNLIENKEKVKMSKRLGIFQSMTDLISYLGQNARDVGRYFFLMRSADAPLDFDLDLAKDESEKNPVFYIQYAHARIASIFRELGESNIRDIQPSDIEYLLKEDRILLLFWIARFPEEVYDASISLEPHRITNYLQALSKSFTKFYSGKENRIKEKSGREREVLLLLAKTTQLAVQRGLALLGISAPEKMSKTEVS